MQLDNRKLEMSIHFGYFCPYYMKSSHQCGQISKIKDKETTPYWRGEGSWTLSDNINDGCRLALCVCVCVCDEDKRSEGRVLLRVMRCDETWLE